MASNAEMFVRQLSNQELQHLPYFHPNLATLEEVKAVMMPYVMKDGYFLLRNSISRPGALTVTVMHTNSIKHFNIGNDQSSYFLQDQRFNSIDELVRYYKNHDVPNMERVEHVRLTRPILYYDSTRQGPPSIERSVSHQVVQTRPQENRPVRPNRSFDASNTFVGSPFDNRPLTINNTAAAATTPDANMPQLPVTADRKKSSLLDKIRRKKPVSESGDGSTPIAERPPMPIPADSRSETPVYDRALYQTPRDIDTDQSSELIYHLRKAERPGEMCECGLSLEDSELPLEWSMHISREAPTEGRIFFMGPNDETGWELPMDVLLLLNKQQQDRITKLRKDFVANHSSGSGSSGTSNRFSAPDLRPSNGMVRGGGASSGQSARGVSMGTFGAAGGVGGGPVSLNRQPQQHECDVFHV